VGNARDQGWTWEQIARLLGVTRQAVHKKHAGGEGRSGGGTDMFEPFTSEARDVVVLAQEEARSLRHAHIGTEHLLLALLRLETPTTAVLRRHRLAHDEVVQAVAAHLGGEALDAEALRTLGIDLDAVRDVAEATFGPGALDAPCRDRRPRVPGHVPFTPRAKKVFELALREALVMPTNRITDGHIALGLLREGQGLAVKVLHDRGVDPQALRAELRRRRAVDRPRSWSVSGTVPAWRSSSSPV
jgi:ATP-dependent Clp protease ATP-binding subunit ClpA